MDNIIHVSLYSVNAELLNFNLSTLNFGRQFFVYSKAVTSILNLFFQYELTYNVRQAQSTGGILGNVIEMFHTVYKVEKSQYQFKRCSKKECCKQYR